MTDSERFEAACRAAAARERTGGIGTLAEKTLHAVLKRYIEPDERFHEVQVGSFVADVFRDERIFEIQTGSFTPLRPKLETKLYLIWNRFQPFTPIAERFLRRVRASFTGAAAEERE